MRKLKVHNFGPVKDVDIELKSVNIFIGEQSVGKSTLAKLITIFTDRILLSRLVIYGYNSWVSLAKDYGIDFCLTQKKFYIEYAHDEGYFVFNMIIEKNAVSFSMIKDGVTIHDKNEIIFTLIENKPIYHKDLFEKRRLLISSEEDNSNIADKIFELYRDSLYIPAERIVYSVIDKLQPALSLAKSIVPDTLSRFMLELSESKEKNKEIKIPLLGITYIRKSDDDYIKIKERDTLLPLQNSSSGIQSYLPFYLVYLNAIDSKEYSSYVIEEPECNLFPDKQVGLLQDILRKISDKSKYLLTITTHSPYLLSTLNNSFFAGFIVEQFGDEAEELILKVLPDLPILKSNYFAIYSLGAKINGKVYCKSLIDVDTHMIDSNTLDSISFKMGNDFSKLEDIYLSFSNENDA